jgi:hypothetical protein
MVEHQPRPMYGIFVAMTDINMTFASGGERDAERRAIDDIGRT